ncbi:RIP metalloprotease RseP [Sphingomonas histidinilytica]|uniref:Zinc metalloprotease n=1 Tax=Rhizorhabdus histidinilytica TaxID=439228 RepID=A0A1T5A968_9SPHN|nr:RIP metalloprotease RseP [Rhizorhabdus histidinilytica]MBO9377328.1 RIP metalloprotease RseP [Rhizorhabdus histidinilytica]QEH78173.1 RIP metalloprotease RseP [Sphingomonas sp. C8-2]SKB31466.1 site-2 protease. Metallo peptidase. MEROPS family M50B [Rhizorhabdus histidinilytica]
MTDSPGILFTILAFLLVIGPLIFVHELGHYLAGRWCGVKADVFSIGFGREIAGYTDSRGTRWKLGWIPMGGYVKFAGDMNPASVPTPEWLALPPEERAKTFQAKPVWQRFLIVFAGPFTNFVVAIGIFMAFFAVYGAPRTPSVVSAVIEGSPAARAGMQPGDRIVAIEGRPIERFDDLADMIRFRPDERLRIDLVRGSETRSLFVVPVANVERDRFGNEFRKGTIGVMSGPQVVVPVPLHELPVEATRQTFGIVRMMVDTLGQIVTGRRSVKELGGPIKIAQVSGQQASLGLLNFVMLMALISINLGFINLLPIPMLDGGHLVFYLFEGIARRPVPERAMEWAFRSGLAVLLSFMIFVTLNDILSLGALERLAGLIG